MYRLLNRYAWRNLPIQTKAVVATLVAVLLFALASVIGATVRAVTQQRETTVLEITAETRALAQNLQFEVGTLERIQSRLVEDVDALDVASFNVLTRVLPDDFEKSALQIKSDLERIIELSADLTGSADNPIAEEAGVLFDAVSIGQQKFDSTLALVSDLTGQGINELVEQGDELEALTLAQNNTRLVSQMLLMRSLERSLIQGGSQAELTALQSAADDYLQIYQSDIPATQRLPSIPPAVERYLQQAEYVSRALADLSVASSSATFTLDVMRDSASRLSTLSEVEVQNALASLVRQRTRLQNVVTVAFLLALALSGLLFGLFGRDIVQRMRVLLRAAQRLESGDLQARVELPGEDEFSQLGHSFNAVAVQLSALIGGLEQRVAERTRDLSITAEIGQLVLEQRDPRELMTEIVELIRGRFGFYHAQVFLLDEAGENANLVASTGAAGRQLLARGHYLPVGSRSVIGRVTASGQPVVALDTDSDAIHRRNELLPDTRSEMALPMRIGDRIIGALDVQSVAPNAFDADDVAVFQIIADQLAIALDNARLYSQLMETRAQLETMQRRLTTEGWRAFTRSRQANAPLAYQLVADNLEPRQDEMLPPPLQNAIRRGTLVMDSSGDDGLNLAVPIRVRGEVIGAFGFGGETLSNLTEEDIALLEAVVDRVGLALENLRLVEQVAQRAEYEQIVNEISAKIAGSTDVAFILQTTVKELGRVLRAPQTSVQLRQHGMGENNE
ncbi:MAG: hypothetical protein Kow00124_17500 [Anaerolineae bacterium]